MKHDLHAMAEQLTSSVEIGYNLALDSFKRKSKYGLCEYYYHVLNIPLTLPYSPTQTQNAGRDHSAKYGGEDKRVQGE